MDNLIDMLKQNKRPFGLMPEEMQAKAKEICPAAFEIFLEKKWVTPSDRFCDDMTYHLRADYKEQVEDKYELCEIEVEPDRGGHGPHLVYADKYGNLQTISGVTGHPNFAGYLYKDGFVYAGPVRYFNEIDHELKWVEIGRIKKGEIVILRPTHVVFSKS